MTAGRVYLVGAGPGDPGLVTLRALDLLHRAEVVVYDRLLDDRMLEAVPPQAERIYVGKRVGEHSRTQDEINRILVEKALEGRMVVRLKGGDPFVLGRGGEEAERLVEHGIPFEVVPGITSAVAVPAYAGIPVTHRGLSASFAVVTGHEDPAKPESQIAWDRLSSGTDTIVFLMGMQNLPLIASKLTEHGRSPETPVAVIREGTRPTQRTVVARLSDIAERVREAGLGAPAVVVVGEVAALRERLQWFDNRPMFGRRVLVTRSRDQASKLSRLLAEHGASPVELPAIDIQPVPDTSGIDAAVLELARYHWIVFTSTNGVSAFFERLGALGRDARALGGLSVAAIGPATAQALAGHGITADFVPETYTGSALVSGFSGRDVSGRRFLLLRANIADDGLSGGLRTLGAEVTDVAVYRTVSPAAAIARAREKLVAGEIDVVTFTSSSTVTNLVSAFDGQPVPTSGAMVACIGPRTAETARKAGLEVDVTASEHTIPGLVAAIEERLAREEA